MKNAQAEDVAALQRSLSSLEGRLEVEARDRQLGDTEVMSRWQELSKSLEHERNDREKGDSAMRSVVSDWQQELRAERAERTGEAAEIARSVQSLEGSILPTLRELRSCLDTEVEERKEVYGWLDKCSKEVRNKVETEMAKREQLAEETRGALKDVRRAVDSEVEVRTEEHTRVALNLSRLSSQLETETRERNHAAVDLSDRLRALSDALGIEASERREADAEIERGVRSLTTNLEHEIRQRTHANETLQQAVRTEALDRSAGDEAASKSQRLAAQRLETMIESLRESMWTKMVSLTDRYSATAREWRENPPSFEVPPPHSPSGILAATVLKDSVYSPRREPLSSISQSLHVSD
jgi:hypothetical protein